ncbi:thiol-activated cytolysin family protein [Portibacter marinus]|uniref:thiol-activated cytolysin family protein n=1 Tax=Portibacter marinus TaxID=2898660 RepID=UPI001F3D9146|nr:thiol-activated cytolysin family protein [Portibacter marinus]
MKNIVFPISIFIFLAACQKQGIETVKELNKEAIESIFNPDDIVPRPESHYEETDRGYNEDVANNGHKFLCNGKKVKETVVIENLTLNAFDDAAATNTASLYPGSIIKIKDYMEQNDLSGIGGIKRAPIMVSSDLGDIREVRDPSQRGNVDKAIKEMENAAGSFSANIKAEAKEAYSLEQSMVHVGLDYKYLGNSVKGRFDFESNIEKHSFIVKFYQIYHTASIGNPETPADLFHEEIDPYKLSDITSSQGPLGLITEVAYGRMLIGIFTYEGVEYNTSAEIEAKFRSGFSKVDGEISTDIKNFFSNSTFKVAILGGDAQEAAAVAGSGLGMESIQSCFQWMKDGGSDPSLGVPIQYKIRQLSDATYPLLAIAGAVEYEVPDCSKLPNHLVIKKTEVTSFPALNEDNGEWDQLVIGKKTYNPDMIQYYQRYTNGEWDWIGKFDDHKWQDVQSSDLPKSLNINIPVAEDQFRSAHVVQFFDQDLLDLQKMGEIQFNFSPYLKSLAKPENENAYPSQIEIKDKAFTAILHLEWTTK